MNAAAAVQSLAALANASRLAVFRLLVVAGPEGVAAGALAVRLDVAPSALSFHLKDLIHAGLIAARREGRYVFYSAQFTTMNRLMSYLTENCCCGVPCAPSRKAGASKSCRPRSTSFPPS